jgi:hypothetical protein
VFCTPESVSVTSVVCEDDTEDSEGTNVDVDVIGYGAEDVVVDNEDKRVDLV